MANSAIRGSGDFNDIGFEPLGLVFGTSVYELQFQPLKSADHLEVQHLSQSLYQARNIALSKMIRQAGDKSADGIICVSIKVTQRPWGEGMAEFVARGTAVRYRSPGSFVTPRGRPFTSDLSTEDFALMVNAGLRPLSFVIGSCVYQMGYLPPKIQSVQQTANSEMPGYGKAIDEARATALMRMSDEAAYYLGDGVINVKVQENSYAWSNLLIEYLASGTCISRPGDIKV